MDHDLIKVVSEDLDYLTEEWTQDIDDASLRRASPVLRSLLVEGQLMKVANYLNEEIYIQAPMISKYEDRLIDRSTTFYQAGGAKYQGCQVQFLSMENRVLSPEEMKQKYEWEKESIDKSYLIKLSKFMKQCSFVVNGVRINREEVIKYIANKRGGAHYDSSRNSEKKGSKGELENKFSLLDEMHKKIMVADKNSVYYELLSIGQRLVLSHDIQRIRAIIGA